MALLAAVRTDISSVKERIRYSRGARRDYLYIQLDALLDELDHLKIKQLKREEIV